MPDISIQTEHQSAAPLQGQMHNSPQYYAYQDEELDLGALFNTLWEAKFWLIGITMLFAVASVFYALSLPNEYKSSAIVAPSSSQAGGDLNNLASQLGGLASLAGVKLGSTESTDDLVAMELIGTWGFVDNFIKTHELQVPIFAAKGWNPSNNQLVIDPEIYDIEEKKWVREAPKGKTVEPTSWELFKEFRERFSISKNNNNGLITVSFTHYSPELSMKITRWLIDDVNFIMKERALNNATSNIAYLESQISKTSLSEMQSVFYSLIQEQIKTRMLAEVSDEYVFNMISTPLAPEEKAKPNRAFICIGITLMGLLLGIFLVLINTFIKNNKKTQTTNS